MSLVLRKALWPAVLAIGFLVFLGTITGARPAYADDIEAICGPEIIQEGDTVLYLFLTDGDPDELFVDLDDITGDSDITSLTAESDEGHDGDHTGHYVELDNPTDFANNVKAASFDEQVDGQSQAEALFEELEAAGFDVAFDLFLECLGDDEDDVIDEILDAIIQCIDIEQCDDDWTQSGTESTVTFPLDVGISPRDIAEFIAAEILDDPELLFENTDDEDDDGCNDLHDLVEDFLMGEGVSEFIADDIGNDVETLCEDGDLFSTFDSIAAVDVTCEEAGTFELSGHIENDADDEDASNQITVQCIGEVDDAEIAAEPTTVEIIPARGSASASLITLNLLDENGDPSGNGTTVVWTTDRCRLSDDSISVPGRRDRWENQIADALEVFGDYNRNNASTTLAINVFVDGLDQTTRTTVEAVAFLMEEDAGDFDEGDVISAVILDCSATNTTPGIAKVLACIDVEGADICKTVNVTVVGPPVAPLVLTTDQTNVRCGERVQITATIKDAAGQNVSDHTLVEVATNAGGVLGGTGAIAAQAGLVSPVSSTVGETVNGVATFFLITSELHQGTYTVLVTTGGGGAIASGGLFSTAPVSGAVTVTCGAPTTTAPAAPSPAATVRAPSTGQGIVPPSTGDAGLADASGSSWALFVIAGLTVFALAGVASIKFARR